MTWLAVLGASLFGSLHCAGMCGGFVAAAQPDGKMGSATLGYQGARLLMYLLLGVSAGAAGAGMDALGTSLGLERAAAAVMGFSLIAAGVAAFFRLRALQEPPLVSARSLHRERPAEPGLIARFRKALAMMAAPGTFMGGAALGAASAFLPCGWLWSFVLVAAGTGSAGGGMATMFALWLGSLPALLAAGWLATQLLSRAGKHAPWIAASLLVAMGLLSLYERWPTEPDPGAAAPPPCHAHAGVEG